MTQHMQDLFVSYTQAVRAEVEAARFQGFDPGIFAAAQRRLSERHLELVEAIERLEWQADKLRLIAIAHPFAVKEKEAKI